jgi:cell division septum initiation protein DivIVA
MRRRKDLSAQQHDLRAGTSERLEEIVEAAERAAERVIDEAEEKADRYLEETRAQADRETEERVGALSELTESLLDQASALRRRAEQLEEALRGVRDRLDTGAFEGATAVEGRFRGTHLAAVAPPEEVVAPQEESATPFRERGTPAGARLLATQMAVSGSSRGEIEARLREGFEIDDTKAILDAILGPEG